MQMGAHSKLVLAKLGHELRGAYDDVLTAPLPPTLSKRVNRLPGLHDILDLRAAPQPWLIAEASEVAPANENGGLWIADDGGPIL